MEPDYGEWSDVPLSTLTVHHLIKGFLVKLREDPEARRISKAEVVRHVVECVKADDFLWVHSNDKTLAGWTDLARRMAQKEVMTWN